MKPRCAPIAFVFAIALLVQSVSQAAPVPPPVQLNPVTPNHFLVRASSPFSVTSIVSGGASIAGVSVTFTAPAPGSGAVFSNGSNSITVLTDTAGIARAAGNATSQPGSFDVQAATAGAPTITAATFVITAPPTIGATTPQSAPYGAFRSLSLSLQYPWFPCTVPSYATELFQGAYVVTVNDIVTSQTNALVLPSSCPLRVVGGEDLNIPLLPFGTYHIVAGYVPGNAALDGVQIGGQVEITPTTALLTPRGNMRVGVADSREHPNLGGTCHAISVTRLAIGSAGAPAALPSTAADAFGPFRLAAEDCTWSSDLGIPGPPLTQRVLLAFDAALDAGTVVWAHGATADNPAPHWYELRTSVSGNFALFEIVDGGAGDEGAAGDRAIYTIFALGRPLHAAIPGTFQDLWWGGLAQNGWGLSLTQHRDVLFGALFIYDAQGDPRWVVMPGGQWDASKTRFSGALYRPKGSPYFAYDHSAFSPGSPVGAVRLTFTNANTLTLETTLDGVSETRTLTRQPFGAPDGFVLPRVDDLWWGGATQNGWGFALAQQDRNLFGVVFTYDEKGETTWLVAPAAKMDLLSLTYSSKLYRTHGSAWLGAPYDPAKFVPTEVGVLQTTFDAARESMTLRYNVEGRAVQSSLVRQPF